MSKKLFACVYGGASERIDKHIRDEIKKLGELLAKENCSLVYGAGATGCMGAVASGVKENGGYVLGITPDFIEDFEEVFECDKTVKVDTMAERKTLMEKHADIFFIAPGGVGTMDEFFQILTLKYLKRINAPIVILNMDGFYDSLIYLVNDLVKKKAATEELHKLYMVITDVTEKTISNILQEL